MSTKTDYFEIINPDFYPVISCRWCSENIIIEEDQVYMDFGHIVEFLEHEERCNEEYEMSPDEVKDILESGDAYDIKHKLDYEYWENDCICRRCYEKFDYQNSQEYEKLLDLIFEGYPKQEKMYRDSMSQHHENRYGGGSAKVLNKIINRIYDYDYYEIHFRELGCFDPGNYDFAVDILKRFAGVDVKEMQKKNREKNIALGRHVY